MNLTFAAILVANFWKPIIMVTGWSALILNGKGK